MHYYEKNIVDIKNEYTTMLHNTLAPLIYEGLKQLYNQAVTYDAELKKRDDIDEGVRNIGVLKIFQNYLAGLKSLNNNQVKEETARIKEKGKCSEWLDDLIKAVVKSNIVLLTFNACEQTCKVVNDKLHEQVDTEQFIHNCYIECAKIFFNYPTIFWHEFPTTKIKELQRESYELIKTAISEAVRKSLPLKLILEEYLKNDYIVGNPQFMSMKSLIDRDVGTSDNRYSESKSDDKLYDISVNRILESSDKVNSVVSEADKLEFDNLIINNMETNLPNPTDTNVEGDKLVEKLEGENKEDKTKTADELSEKLKDPRYITEPIKIKKSKNPIIDEINRVEAEKKLQEENNKLENKSENNKIEEKIKSEDNKIKSEDNKIKSEDNKIKTEDNKIEENKHIDSDIQINKKVSRERARFFDKIGSV